MALILCIDDDPVILTLQKHILEANGYAAVVAQDGPTGIAFAGANPVDLVVLDFKMPGMDGGEVAEALIKHRPDLPIVVCTGFFDAVPEWLKWFAAAFIQKGEGPEALLAAIQALLADCALPTASGGSSSLRQTRAA